MMRVHFADAMREVHDPSADPVVNRLRRDGAVLEVIGRNVDCDTARMIDGVAKSITAASEELRAARVALRKIDERIRFARSEPVTRPEADRLARIHAAVQVYRDVVMATSGDDPLDPLEER